MSTFFNSESSEPTVDDVVEAESTPAPPAPPETPAELPSDLEVAISGLKAIADRAPTSGGVSIQVTRLGDIARGVLRSLGQ